MGRKCGPVAWRALIPVLYSYVQKAEASSYAEYFQSETYILCTLPTRNLSRRPVSRVKPVQHTSSMASQNIVRADLMHSVRVPTVSLAQGLRSESEILENAHPSPATGPTRWRSIFVGPE